MSTFLGAHEIPDEYRGSADGLCRDWWSGEMLPQVVAKEKLAKYCDVFCEPKVFAGRSRRGRFCLRPSSWASGCGSMPTSSLARGRRSWRRSWERRRPIIWSNRTRTSIAALKEAECSRCCLPGSVYAIGSQKYAPARAMIEAGLGVVIATDFNPGSSPTTSMPMVMSLACTQMKMTPAEALTAATINAACSLDLRQ